MALAKLLSLIHFDITKVRNTLENNLPQLIKHSRHDEIISSNNFIYLLVRIRNLIESSNGGTDTNKIIEAARLIEQVPLTISGHKVCFREVLLANYYDVFNKSKQNFNLDTLLYTPEIAKSLSGIHYALVRYYKTISKLHSVWQTSADDNASLLDNSIIKNWQEKQAILSNSSRAYNCFRRGITFGDEFFLAAQNTQRAIKPSELSDEELTLMLQRFVEQAFGYTEDEKAYIVKWLKCNGGQENSRFIDELLSENYLIQTSFTPGLSKPLEQHWYITKDGKICLNYDVLYLSLQQGSTLTLFMSLPKKGSHVPAQMKLGDYGQYATDLESLYEQDPKRRQPVMRINTSLKLEISSHENDKIITPNIIHLNVQAFTDLLEPSQAKTMVRI